MQRGTVHRRRLLRISMDVQIPFSFLFFLPPSLPSFVPLFLFFLLLIPPFPVTDKAYGKCLSGDRPPGDIGAFWADKVFLVRAS